MFRCSALAIVACIAGCYVDPVLTIHVDRPSRETGNLGLRVCRDREDGPCGETRDYVFQDTALDEDLLIYFDGHADETALVKLQFDINLDSFYTCRRVTLDPGTTARTAHIGPTTDYWACPDGTDCDETPVVCPKYATQ